MKESSRSDLALLASFLFILACAVLAGYVTIDTTAPNFTIHFGVRE